MSSEEDVDDFSPIEGLFGKREWREMGLYEKKSHLAQFHNAKKLAAVQETIRPPKASQPNLKRRKLGQEPTRSSARTHSSKSSNTSKVGINSTDSNTEDDSNQDATESRHQSSSGSDFEPLVLNDSTSNSFESAMDTTESVGKSDDKDKLSAFMDKYLPGLLPSTKKDVLDILQGEGVETLKDLSYIENSDCRLPLKTVQIAKFWEGYRMETQAGTKPQSSGAAHKPPPKSVTLNAAAENWSSFAIDWTGMEMSTRLREALEGEDPLEPGDKRTIVYNVSKQAKNYYDELKMRNPSLQKTPGRAVYRRLANDINEAHPEAFVMVLRGQQIAGLDFLVDSLEHCIENLYRAKQSSGRRVTKTEMRKSYGSKADKWNPPVIDPASQDEKQKKLLEEFSNRRIEWDWNEILQDMDASFQLQREHMVGPEAKTVKNIRKMWPFLFERAGMVQHFKELTEVDLHASLTNYLVKDQQNVIDFMTTMPSCRKVNMKIKINHGNSLPSSITMICNYFKEDIKDFVVELEESATEAQIMQHMVERRYPCLVSFGKRFETEDHGLVIDGQVVTTSISNIFDGIILMFASYFVFGIQYPSLLNGTLTFIERFICGINEADGKKVKGKATSAKGNDASSTYVAKVSALAMQIEKFVKDLNE